MDRADEQDGVPGPAASGRAGAGRVRRVGRVAGRAGVRAGRVARAGAVRVRTAAGADGARESGMSALLGAHALHSAGDALLAVALAGTVFFDVPLGEARDRVGLYLLLTLLPFSLLVPVAGPLLDRLRHGRRDVLAVTTGARGLVAWSMAGLTASIGLYPLALGALVLSRAYGVARSAALPRVRPPGVSPVKANARMNVAAVASASAAGALGAGLGAVAGAPWVLRLAGLVLLAGAFVALKLPPQVDEERAPRPLRPARYRLLEGPAALQRALVSAVALRGLAGLLTVFLAFLLKSEGAPAAVVAAVLGAAVAGQLLGTALASRLPEHVTARLTVASLAAPAAACVAAAAGGGPALAALAAGTAGLSYALSKFALDAAVQGLVPSESTSGAFARSETGLQLAWALGGAVALVLPPVAAVGFAVAAAVPLLGVVAGSRAQAGRGVLPRRRPHDGAGPAGDGPGVAGDGPRGEQGRDDTVVLRRAQVRRDDPAGQAGVPRAGGGAGGAPSRVGAAVPGVPGTGDGAGATARGSGRVAAPRWGGAGRPDGPDGPDGEPTEPLRLRRGHRERERQSERGEPRVPRGRDPRAERGSTLDRWRHQAGGPPPRASRWRRARE